MPAINAPEQRPSQRSDPPREELVALNYGRLYRWFLWLTNSPGDAADLTQDTFVAVWESLDRFEAGKPLTPWLFGVARNVWRNHNSARRRRASGDEGLLENLPHPAPDPEEAMVAREAIRLLERAVAELPLDYREAVVLRFWEDLGYGEIAQALSITEGLARWRVHQARKLLSQRLSETAGVAEQAFRAGGKVGWWMRAHRRPAPPLNLLERCMSTISPARITPKTSLPQHAASQNEDALLSAVGTDERDAAQGVRVGTLDELRAKGCVVARHGGRNVAVFHHDGKVRAVENRCPHMGFPLHRGSIRDGVLTCFWHNARFDLASGCTFDLWADDVPAYPVEVRDGEVWLLPRPPRDEVAHWRQRLREGMQHNLGLVTAKAVLGLLHRGADPVEIVGQAVLFGSCYQDDWGDGLTILTANANLLHYLNPEERFLPLWHGVVRVSKNLYEASPHWDPSRRPGGGGRGRKVPAPFAGVGRPVNWRRSTAGMAKQDGNPPEQQARPRPARPGGAPPPQPHAPAGGRYDAPGDEPLAVPAPLALDEPFRFDRGLAKRLRMREVNAKEAFTVRDGSGVWFRASVKEYDGRGGRAVAYERMGRSPEPTVDLTLACAVLARQRMHLVVQKATELGVRRIVPLLTDRSVPPDAVEHEQAHAWPGHVARAARQCRRSSLPHLLAPAALDAFLASPLFAAADLRLFLDDRGDGSPDPAPDPAGPPARIVLLVGPEGGFSDAERHLLAVRARPWVLGGRVLRAETAVLVGLTAVHLTWGDFSHAG